MTANEELKWFIIILLVAGFLWYQTGGYERYKAQKSKTSTTTPQSKILQTNPYQNQNPPVETKTYIVP